MDEIVFLPSDDSFFVDRKENDVIAALSQDDLFLSFFPSECRFASMFIIMDPMFPAGPPQFIFVPRGSLPVPIINQVPVMMQPPPFPLFAQPARPAVPPPVSHPSADLLSEDRLEEKVRR